MVGIMSCKPKYRNRSGRVSGKSMRSRICAICLSRPPTAAYGFVSVSWFWFFQCKWSARWESSANLDGSRGLQRVSQKDHHICVPPHYPDLGYMVDLESFQLGQQVSRGVFIMGLR